jgi:hypothetical protein
MYNSKCDSTQVVILVKLYNDGIYQGRIQGGAHPARALTKEIHYSQHVVFFITPPVISFLFVFEVLNIFFYILFDIVVPF